MEGRCIMRWLVTISYAETLAGCRKECKNFPICQYLFHWLKELSTYLKSDTKELSVHNICKIFNNYLYNETNSFTVIVILSSYKRHK